MPPRRKKPSGLTEDDVARLRSQLDEGRRPRVALSGPQFEAGASGSVVRIGDPAVDGADFLTVRVKVNGVTDELAFAPAELNIGRTRAGSAGAGSVGGRTRTTPPRAAAAKSGAAASPAPTSGLPAPASPAPSTAAAGQGKSSAAAGGSSGSEATTRAGTTPAPVSPPASAGTAAADNAAAGNAPSSRRRKPPATPAVSVTISSTGASWTVSASRGARTVTKSVPIPPGVVTAVAELLGQPGLSEAVAEINETARQLAEQRAEQLRAELSDLEAMLATHRTPR